MKEMSSDIIKTLDLVHERTVCSRCKTRTETKKDESDETENVRHDNIKMQTTKKSMPQQPWLDDLDEDDISLDNLTGKLDKIVRDSPTSIKEGNIIGTVLIKVILQPLIINII